MTAFKTPLRLCACSRAARTPHIDYVICGTLPGWEGTVEGYEQSFSASTFRATSQRGPTESEAVHSSDKLEVPTACLDVGLKYWRWTLPVAAPEEITARSRKEN